MGRPISYHTADGKRVPSVTSCLSQLGWNKESLIRWANRCGLEGQSLDDARGGAATVGTIVHAMIEGHLKGEPVDVSKLSSDLRDPAEIAFAAFLEWKGTNVVGVLLSEKPMVSEALRVGGTPDLIYKDQNEQIALLDYKAAGGTYADNVVQIAGYGVLWDELHPDDPVKRYQVLRIDKENGGFHWSSWPAVALEPARDAFRAARALYDLKRRCEDLT